MPLTGTGPRAAGLVARERLERRGVSALSDAELLTILAGPNGSRAADAVLDECGAVQALPQENAGDLARIDGVTPRAAGPPSAAGRPEAREVERPGLGGFGAGMDPLRASEFQLAWAPGRTRRTGLPGRPRRLPGRSGRPGFGRVRRTGAAVPGLQSAPTTESSL